MSRAVVVNLRMMFVVVCLAISQTTCTTKKSESADPGTDGGGDFSQGQQPVPVTGTNLAAYTNTRVRCDYSAATTASTYNAQCAVVAHQQGGQEYFAVAVRSGVTLAWQPPSSVSGDMAFNNCSPSANSLTYKCAVTVNSNSTPAEANFSVQIKDATNASRTESANLLLPYSVGVAGGFVPSMPYQYVSLATASAAGSSTTSQLGFQQFSFPPNLTPTSYPFGIASCGASVYYSSGSSIFKVTNKMVSFYAGSANSQDSSNLSDATRLYMLPAYLACAPGGGIYVGSSILGRIYKIVDSGAVTLIAGNGATGDGVDGNLAVNSPLGDVRTLAVNSKGEVLFSDLTAHAVRKVTTSGLLGTVAGSGSAGYAGDGGLATAAALSSPIGIAVGPDDSIYIADNVAAVVRKVAPNGLISTLAGTGTQRYNTNPVNPLALSEPVSVYADASSNVYVGERYRGIKKLLNGGASNQIVSAGPDVMASTNDMVNDVQLLNEQNQHSPYLNIVNQRPNYFQLVAGTDGTFYVDGEEGVIAYLPNSTSATIFVGAADSPPADCKTAQPAFLTRLYEGSALAILPNHSLVVLDYSSQNSDQLVLHTFTAGSSAGADVSKATFGCTPTPSLIGFNPNLATAVNSIGAMASGSDGSVYVANMGGNAVVKITAQGSMINLAGNGTNAYTPDGATAASSPVQLPVSIALGPDGSVYFVEYGGNLSQLPADGSRIRKISPTGILITVAGTGAGGDSGEAKAATQADITADGIAVSKDGRLFMTDYGSSKIKMVDTQGIIHTIAGGGTLSVASDTAVAGLQAQLSGPSSIGITNDGTLYFINSGSNQVMQMKQQSDGSWNVVTIFGAKRTADCGTSRISGTASAGGVSAAVNSSLSIMCQGTPRTLTVADTCPAVGGDTRIAFNQGVDTYANIIQIVKPRGT